MTNLQQQPPPEIVFDDIGKGPTVVFLHGFLESKEVWAEFADKLSRWYRVINIDLPGHGHSDNIAEVHTMDFMAEEVRNILEILGINKAVLVGHSMGGYVAMAFASRFGNMLKGLVLFHSHAGADSPEQMKNRDLGIRAVENDHLGFIASFTPTLFAPENVPLFGNEIHKLANIAGSTPVTGVIAAMKGMKERQDTTPTLQKLKVPGLVIAGDKDDRIPVDMLKEQIGGNPKIRLVVLENTGHMGFVESKDKSFKLISNFCRSAYQKKK